MVTIYGIKPPLSFIFLLVPLAKQLKKITQYFDSSCQKIGSKKIKPIISDLSEKLAYHTQDPINYWEQVVVVNFSSFSQFLYSNLLKLMSGWDIRTTLRKVKKE